MKIMKENIMKYFASKRKKIDDADEFKRIVTHLKTVCREYGYTKLNNEILPGITWAIKTGRMWAAHEAQIYEMTINQFVDLILSLHEKCDDMHDVAKYIMQVNVYEKLK